VWVFEVGVLEECSGLIMGRRCYKTNQRVSQPDILTFLCRKDEMTGYVCFEHWVVNFFPESVWLWQW